MARESAQGVLTQNSITDGAIGVVLGLVLAHSSRKGGGHRYGPPMILGGVLGVLGGALLRTRRGGGSTRTITGFSPPPHPIEIMPKFDPQGSPADQARAVLYDYGHDNDVRSWVDDGNVKKAFGVKQKEDYDPSQLAAAYENKNDRIWRGGQGRMNWAEMNKVVQQAIAKRKKLGALPKACYDKNPITIYYYDDHLMKKVEYDKSGLANMLNPNNHYYWRDPSVHTYQTDKPDVIADEQRNPCRKGHAQPGAPHDNWDDEGFDWDKDAVGQIDQITSTTLQLIGLAMQATGYLGAVGSAVSHASPYIGMLAGLADDAFQGNDNSKAVAAISKIILEVANKGFGEATGVELPPAAMKVLGEGVDTIGQQIAAGQQSHLDYTGIWGKILAKSKTFTKIGDPEAHAISKILGENAAGSTFIKGYQAGKLSDLPTIDAISKLWMNQGNANVWMLGAGLGQLAVHQGAATPTHKAATAVAARRPITATAHAASPATTHAASGYGYGYPYEPWSPTPWVAEGNAFWE